MLNWAYSSFFSQIVWSNENYLNQANWPASFRRKSPSSLENRCRRSENASAPSSRCRRRCCNGWRARRRRNFSPNSNSNLKFRAKLLRPVKTIILSFKLTFYYISETMCFRLTLSKWSFLVCLDKVNKAFFLVFDKGASWPNDLAPQFNFRSFFNS